MTQHSFRYSHGFWLVMLLTVLCIAEASITTINRLHAFDTYFIDQGLFHMQALQIAAGEIPRIYAITPYENATYFGIHFSPILFLLAPVYWLWPGAETLFVVQAVLVYSALPILFLLGRKMSIAPWACVAFVLLTCLNPYFFRTAYNDFHEIAFAVPFMCLGLLALASRNFLLLLLACAGLVLTKEHYGIAVLGFGIAWGLHHGDWRRGGGLAAAGIICAVVVLGFVLPAWHGGTQVMAAASADPVLNRYSWIKFSLETFTALYELMTYGGINMFIYGILLLVMAGCFPILLPLFLLPGAADLLANMLSAVEQMRQPYFYYSVALVPVFTAAAMHAWQKAPQFIERPQLRKVFLLLGFAACCAMFPATFKVVELVAPKSIDAETLGMLEQMKKEMQGCKRPLVQSNIAANMDPPASAAPFVPEILPASDCAILWLGIPAKQLDPGEMSSSPYIPLLPKKYPGVLKTVLESGEWRVAQWHNPWLFLKKASNGETLKEAAARAGALLQVETLQRYYDSLPTQRPAPAGQGKQ